MSTDVIIVHVDHDRGEIDPLSLQALSAAGTLGGDVVAAVATDNAQGLSESAQSELQRHGASAIRIATHAGLRDYAPQATARSLQQLAADLQPKAILAAGSARGNEVMAHLAAMLDLPLATDCTHIALGSGQAEVTRARWGGNLLEEARVIAPVLLATTLPHTFTATPAAGNGVVTQWAPQLDDADLLVQVIDRVLPSGSGGVGLTEAKVVIPGGRGVGGPEGFVSLEQLAEILGGTVGCSRVVTSAGWRPHAEQVGQTGTKVAPDLYIACGISGATQHLAGCKNSKTLIAINTDPDAPIMKVADFIVVDDLHAVLPEVINAIGH